MNKNDFKSTYTVAHILYIFQLKFFNEIKAFFSQVNVKVQNLSHISTDQCLLLFSVSCLKPLLLSPIVIKLLKSNNFHLRVTLLLKLCHWYSLALLNQDLLTTTSTAYALLAKCIHLTVFTGQWSIIKQLVKLEEQDSHLGSLEQKGFGQL